MFFGFERINGKWVERVPLLFKALSFKEQREFFINQYNYFVCKNERIGSKRNFHKFTLFEIFQNKILSTLKNDNVLCPSKLKLFDPYSAVLIALFISGDFDRLKVAIKTNASLPKLPQAMLI
ncbi:MAG: hypothetical protein LBD84_02805, partial [Campylobacteraceae bacterium]|nr:hypothetical protein [Campylobacteraceae bacterium]